MKTYSVKEIFYSVQGEGVNIGVPAVFVRFSGCNLWSGRNEDRDSAVCKFCDTEFVGGYRMTLEQIVSEISMMMAPLVIFTGGEPALQLDQELVDSVRDMHRMVAVETNGTRALPHVDWICVSPKAETEVVVREADELKLVYPQTGITPEQAEKAVRAPVKWVSPMDGPDLQANTQMALEYVSQHPDWRLNIQAHKHWGVR